MLKKGMSKSILMTALITGNVIWGGTAVYAEEGLQQFNLYRKLCRLYPASI